MNQLSSRFAVCSLCLTQQHLEGFWQQSAVGLAGGDEGEGGAAL